ncbi:MAG: hypothetical protein JOZ78_20190 [Chroococcidiopsidaceae cyanobacterium CP_BM_ER_R8_30]|nr:hypothetical protein [Chroococcidiopsidaceae cyanobacterium CP_BM_ER_R8_30]
MDKKRYTLEQANQEAQERGLEVVRVASGFLVRSVGCDCEDTDWKRGCVKYERLSRLVEGLDARVAAREREQRSQEVARVIARDIYERIEERIRQVGAEMGIPYEQLREPFFERVARAFRSLAEQVEQEKLEAEYRSYDQRFVEYVARSRLLEGSEIMKRAELVHPKQLRQMEEQKSIERMHYADFPADCVHPDFRRYGGKSNLYHCSVTFPLSPEQRQELDNATLLTRLEAAAFLDIPETEFDRLKKKLGINQADQRPGRGLNLYYLYRFSDVLLLQSQL